MIGFWKKIENGGCGGFSVILFKLGNLKNKGGKKLWKIDIVYRW